MSSRWREHVRHAVTLRLGLWYVALFIVSASALLVFTYVLLARALAAQDHQVLESMLSRYAIQYQQAGLAGLEGLVEQDASEGQHERLLVRVADASAELVYFSTPPGWSGFDLSGLDRTSALQSGWTAIADPANGTTLEVGTARLGNGVTVQVGRSSVVRDQLLAGFRQRALVLMLIVTLVAVAGGGLLTHVGLEPLRSLEAAVRAILRTGRFDARVATQGTRDPLDELGGLVNEMLARIDTLVGGMRGALDNVAHDLRTPLTRFRSVAEAALVADDPAAVRDGLAQALEEAERMNQALTALMDISEAETGTMRLARERVPVAAVVQEAMSLYADEAEEKGIVLESTVPDDLALVADRTRLRQVLANLIENAVKYIEGTGRVTIEAAARAGTVVLTVRDTGVGIAESDLPLVWDRLYRADATRAARGLGLGLSLVRAIVEAHGGTVSVSSAPGAGSAFAVTLPVEPPGDGGRRVGRPSIVTQPPFPGH